MPQESSFTSNSDASRENELRHRNNIESLDAEQEQPEIIVNPQVEVMSSSNDFLWTVLIAALVSAIILLVLRRLFLV